MHSFLFYYKFICVRPEHYFKEKQEFLFIYLFTYLLIYLFLMKRKTATNYYGFWHVITLVRNQSNRK